MKHTICEPEKQLPVVGEADVCVCGGGCTGVFAAIRAARLGCSVILCEETNVLGAAPSRRAFLRTARETET